MKISWIRTAIVVITLFLFLSLIFFHNTSTYHNGDHSINNKLSRIQFNPIDIYDSSKNDIKQIHNVNTDRQDKILVTSIIPKNNQEDVSLKDSTLNITNETSDSIDHSIELPLKMFIKPIVHEQLLENSILQLAHNNNISIKQPDIINVFSSDSNSLSNAIIDSNNAIEVNDSENVFNLLKLIQLPLIEQYLLQLKSNGDLYIPYLRDEKATQKEFQFNIVDNFHKSLKHGSICTKNQLSKNLLYQSIEGLLSKVAINTIIEYDYEHIDIANTISYALAKTNPILTAILLRYKSMKYSDNSNDITKSNCKDIATGSNIFVSYINNDKKHSNLLDLNHHQQFNCIQIVSDFDLLVNNLLPFEYEMSLANILCQCNITYLPNTLPEMNSYFAFWDSVAHLIDSAQVIAKKICAWTVVMNDVSSTYISSVKYSHIIIQRNHTLLLPQRSQSKQQHQQYKDNDNQKSLSLIKYNSHIPVKVLLNLPLNVYSRQILWSSILHYLNVLDSSIEMNNLLEESFTNLLWLDNLVMRGSMVCNESEILDNTAAPLPFSSSISSSNTNNNIHQVSSIHNNSMSSDSYVINAVKRYSKYHYVNGVLKKDPLEINVAPSNTLGNNKSSITTSNSRRLSSSSSSYSRIGSSSTNKYGTSSSSVDSLPDLYDNTVSWDIISTKEEEIPPPAAAVLSPKDTRENPEYDREISQYISELSSKKSSYTAKSNLDSSSLKYYRPSSSSYIHKTSSTSVKYTVSSISRTLQRHLYMREQKYYQRLMSILDDTDITTSSSSSDKNGDNKIKDMNTKENILNSMKKSNLIYIMGKHISLFSLKLSKLLSQDDPISQHTSNILTKKPLIVSLLSDSLSITSHRILTNVMELKNNIITTPNWNLAFILGLVVTPERGDYSIIQVDVLIAIITSILANDDYAKHPDIKETDDSICKNKALLMEQSISILLSLSTITYIEVPSLVILYKVFQSIIPLCTLELNQRYTQKNLLEMSLLQLQLNTKININIMNTKEYIHSLIKTYKINIQYNIQNKFMNHKFKLKNSNYGLSLYTALQMGIIKHQKKLLLKMLINFPLWRVSKSLDEITSWNLFIQISTSRKSNIFKKSKSSWSITYHNNNNNNITNPPDITDTTIPVLQKEEEDLKQPIAPLIDAFHSRNHQAYTEQLRQEQHALLPPSSPLYNNIHEPPPLANSHNNHNDNNRRLMQENDEVYRANEVDDSPLIDRKQGQILWKLLENEFYSHKAELANGKFSFIDHDSGYGYLSLRIAKEFPNATVISLEKDAIKAGHHVSMIKSLKILNNAVCLKAESDDVIHKNIYESPELFRFQILSNSLLDSFIHSHSLSDWGQMIGTVLSTSLTSFIYTPLANQVSWAMFLLYGEVYEFGLKDIPEQGPQVGVFTRYSLDKPFRHIGDILDITPINYPGYSNDINMIYELNYINKHPQYPYIDFEGRWLLDSAIINGGQTAVQISSLAVNNHNSDIVQDAEILGHRVMFPLVRCDIINMTRHVHHHYEYSKDGHTRTYTMEVIVNQTLSNFVTEHLGDASQAMIRNSLPGDQGGLILQTELGDIKHIYSMSLSEDHLEQQNLNPISNATKSNDAYVLPEGGVLLPLGYHPNQHNIVGVHLHRDKDSFPIPYTSIYGVTLITALRLGLESTLRDELFKSFLSMSLYEDMAPWNIVLMGKKLDYIDYDTKEFTFNDIIPKAYQIMTVLMNYKRTVEDFQRCGSKSPTVYGLPYVSDCVGTNIDRTLTCPDLKLPVPCADGLCHTDYISCLQAITEQASILNDGKNNKNYNTNQKLINDVNIYKNSYIDKHFIAAMKSIIGEFNQNQSITKSIEK